MYTPKRPYFLRAAHQWLTDNDLTPYLVVDVNHPHLVAPTEYAQNGTLTLNISYSATHNLVIEDDCLHFSARFGGVSKDLWIPMAAVWVIFAKEDPEQIFHFDPEEYNTPTEHIPNTDEDAPQQPTLRIIK